MNKTLVSKFKWFWIWQDDKEEAWLGEMSQQGLHLKTPGLFGRYLFARGEPRKYAYQMDFMTPTKKQEDYLQELQGTGWEYIGQLGNWHYWRKAFQSGEQPGIHPNAESKIQKYKRVLGFLIIFLPIFLMQITRADDALKRYEHWSIQILFGAFYILFLVYLCAILMIIHRISALNRTAKEK